MPRTTTVFVCRECGAETPRWAGQCPSCRAWNTLEETAPRPARASQARVRPQATLNGAPTGQATAGRHRTPAIPIPQVPTADSPRLALDWGELNRVLGGGLVAGSVVLLAGEPGVGKSTLLMHLGAQVAARGGTVLYASAEESAHQVRSRAERLGALHESLLMLAETDVELIVEAIVATRPAVAIVDSIQTVHDTGLDAAGGSVTQVRECAARLTRAAKDLDVPVVLVGHVTKEGSIAGPRVLEHMVDAVLYLEGENRREFRILRAQKNRFGSTDEIGIFSMMEAGLEEVTDASGFFLEARSLGAPGVAVVPVMEGTRPLLLEVQGLAAETGFPAPRRTANGYDLGRVHMIAAVLQRRAAVDLSRFDLYVNIAGGVRVSEPAADLGVALALAGSGRETGLGDATVCFGEVGLAGEVRRVARLDRRVAEAARQGFGRAIVPRLLPGSARPEGIELVEVRTLAEAVDLLVPVKMVKVLNSQ